MVLDRFPDIGNHVIGQVIQVDPAQFITFFRLGIDRLSLPVTYLHEEIDALVPVSAMDHRGKHKIIRLDADACLFQPFAPRGGNDRFAAIQMPCRDAVLPVPIASVEPAQQQDLILPKKQQVYRDGEGCAHEQIILSRFGM